MANILLIEDNADITFAVSMGLQRAGYQVSMADTEAQGKAEYVRVKPELVLLDYNLPDGSGESVCRWVKSQGNTPIIFLTVRDQENDVVHGLELGADDYITKPFSLAILLSRVAAVLRRSISSGGDCLQCGDITLDRTATRVTQNGSQITLTAQEYRLLLVLMEHKNQTLTRIQLLERLWDADGKFVSDNTLTVTMRRLREKLGYPDCIQTLRGIGYRMEG
ncbi:MAG: response regulator transcription factor [Butyricicoccus pullicaecorum]|nr:response regulator transcription factor [Butyricicoccus pullicaecorum]